MKQPSAKVPAILLGIATVTAVMLFSFANDNPYLLWGGLGAAALAVILLLVTLTRFLRNRSITSGLFITTTAITGLYFVGSRFVDTALPLMITNAAVADSANGNATAMANNGFFSPVIFAQIGLFALWFLLVLFIIYVYVRPIKKIDLLLSQIIDAKEIKKLRLGKGRQYQNIAAKLQVLANEKHTQEQKRLARLAKSRERAGIKKALVDKILKETDKIPAPKPTE